ncbi:uncharacterized protein LOC132714938 [Ruditapes philippinarum]|uniref:uncharacterized protein LOC132714938 n=1 Tax=Ruditapes philippinarum TaxID=129788 RepID=UPI00295BA74F|nr:uncharacterized protein LOC132714938 [Ruditapes philippinarum]
MIGKAVIICLVVVCAVSAFDPSYTYYNQFTGPRGEMNSVQSKLNTLESKLNMMENRQQAMTNAINREISKLEMDTRSIKTVINTLAEDNYKTHSQIDVLKGHSEFMVNIGRKVMALEQNLMKLNQTINGEPMK